MAQVREMSIPPVPINGYGIIYFYHFYEGLLPLTWLISLVICQWRSP